MNRKSSISRRRKTKRQWGEGSGGRKWRNSRRERKSIDCGDFFLIQDLSGFDPDEFWSGSRTTLLRILPLRQSLEETFRLEKI